MATRGKVINLTYQYIAGFFDADGGLNIYQTKKGVNKDRIGYQLSVYIFNTDKRIIDAMYNEFGGYIHIRKRPNPKWSDAYEWKISVNKALDFLKNIEPYLIVKKERAKIAIEFQELKKRKKYRFAPCSKEEDDFQELCYQKMRLLNKKGKGEYYPQRLSEETLKKEAIVRTALKNAEQGRNDLAALQAIKNNQRKATEAARLKNLKSKVNK